MIMGTVALVIEWINYKLCLTMNSKLLYGFQGKIK